MNVKGFLKNVLTTDPKENTGDPTIEGGAQPQPPPTTAPGAGGGSGMSGFLSGTSRFLDSVQTKKNGLINDLSSKLTQFKMTGDQSDEVDGKKSSKKRSSAGGEGDDEDSSASEYGDDGDKPMYAETAPIERQVSVESVDSLPEDEAGRWKSTIKEIVSGIVYQTPVSDSKLSEFKTFVTRHTGRSCFAKELRNQVRDMRSVQRQIIDHLSYFVGQVLHVCNENDDFAPAYNLMQISFALYNETVTPQETSVMFYLYQTVRDQPIWQSMRFWNAAFFIALQKERSVRKPPTGIEGEAALIAEQEFQNDIAFTQLSIFIWRMYALGINQELCSDFLRKQASATNLPADKVKTIQKNMQKFFDTVDNEVPSNQ